MRKLNNRIIIAILTIFIFQNQSILIAGLHNGDSTNTRNSLKIIDSSNSKNENTFAWRNSPYIALGYGYPQGSRLEIGYNISSIISLGFIVGFNDYWSKHSNRNFLEPIDNSYGLAGKLFIPIESLNSIPYIFVAAGQNFSIFGFSNTDSYIIFNIGMIVPVTKWLQIRPEFGLDFTSRYLSGGHAFFIGERDTPEIDENMTRIGFNLSFEIDVFSIFR